MADKGTSIKAGMALWILWRLLRRKADNWQANVNHMHEYRTASNIAFMEREV